MQILNEVKEKEKENNENERNLIWLFGFLWFFTRHSFKNIKITHPLPYPFWFILFIR